MANHVGELNNGDASLELFHDKGVAEVIDLGSFDSGNTEIAVDGGSDVTDQERIARFGNKQGGVFGFGATSHVFFDSRLGGSIEGDFASLVTFEGTNFEIRFFESNILELDTR